MLNEETFKRQTSVYSMSTDYIEFANKKMDELKKMLECGGTSSKKLLYDLNILMNKHQDVSTSFLRIINIETDEGLKKHYSDIYNKLDKNYNYLITLLRGLIGSKTEVDYRI